MEVVIAAVISLLVGGVGVFLVRKMQDDAKKKSAHSEADRILNKARSEAARIDKDAKSKAKDFESRARKKRRARNRKAKKQSEN